MLLGGATELKGNRPSGARPPGGRRSNRSLLYATEQREVTMRKSVGVAPLRELSRRAILESVPR